MNFLWPSMLQFLLAVPLLALIYIFLWRRRRSRAAAQHGFGLLQASAAAQPGIRRHIPPMLFLAALTAMGVALGRPQSVVSLPSVQGTVILVFDVSGSMSARDAEPNRLEAAKAAARGFVERQPPTVQVGIVAFSDGGLSILPPTNEQSLIVDAINRLSPQRASAVGSGIEAALELILSHTGGADGSAPPAATPGSPTGVIVLLSDGENNMTPDPLETAQLARDAGVRVDAIGFGSAAGQTLEVNGFMIHTSLDEESLKQIAQLGGGRYFNGSSSSDLTPIYQGIQPRLVIEETQIEITSLFAALGMLVLLIGGALSLLWFGRVP